MGLFKNRVFGISLMISLAWHLLWIFIPNVVLVPEVRKPQKFPVIAFLGPILEETAFKRKPSEHADPNIALDRKILISDEPILKMRLPEDRLKGGDTGQPARKELVDRRSVYGPHKKVPNYLPPLPQRKVILKTPPFEIEGSVKDRGLVSYPPTLTLPRWARESGLEFVLKLRFWVSPLGVVRGVEPEVSSGYPEIDLLGIRYVRKLRFHPLGETGEKAGDWGAISFNLQ